MMFLGSRVQNHHSSTKTIYYQSFYTWNGDIFGPYHNWSSWENIIISKEYKKVDSPALVGIRDNPKNTKKKGENMK